MSRQQRRHNRSTIVPPTAAGEEPTFVEETAVVGSTAAPPPPPPIVHPLNLIHNQLYHTMELIATSPVKVFVGQISTRTDPKTIVTLVRDLFNVHVLAHEKINTWFHVHSPEDLKALFPQWQWEKLQNQDWKLHSNDEISTLPGTTVKKMIENHLHQSVGKVKKHSAAIRLTTSAADAEILVRHTGTLLQDEGGYFWFARTDANKENLNDYITFLNSDMATVVQNTLRQRALPKYPVTFSHSSHRNDE